MSQNQDKRILLVEDNEKIMEGNRKMFQWEGYTTDCALTLAEARACMAENSPDAIVLDIMLPDGTGLDFMAELRQGNFSGVPVLLLTGMTAQEDIIAGLEAGGDDYLTKPYDFPVLLARTQALLRRAARVPEIVRCGGLRLELASGAAYLNDKDLLLAQKEFALLLLFVQNPQRYLNGEYLYEKVWKAPMTGDSSALKSTIKRLRTKLAGSGWQLEWTRGEGYSFQKD